MYDDDKKERLKRFERDSSLFLSFVLLLSFILFFAEFATMVYSLRRVINFSAVENKPQHILLATTLSSPYLLFSTFIPTSPAPFMGM